MTPRLAAGLVGVAVLVTGATGLYWKGRLEGAARERPKVEAALAKAAVAGLQTRGARESAVRVDDTVRTRDAANRSVIHITREAQKSEDANAPLAPARIARLRAHDEQLCDAARLAGCSPSRNTGGSSTGVRAASAARKGDPS